jgi:hypothetical protein
VESSIAKFDTRITTLESSYEAMRIVDGTQTADISQIRSNLSANDAMTAGINQRVEAGATAIADLVETAKVNGRNIASLDARTSAGFVEVESQLRGTTAMISVVVDAINEKIGTLWHKVIGQPLPESKSIPSNIPAQATTTIGGSAAQ